MSNSNLILIVTAIDEKELSSMTRALHGREVPKALAMIASGGSLVQQMVYNFHSIASAGQIHVVVPTRDEAQARKQLSSWSGARVVAMPESTGSASSILEILGQVMSDLSRTDVVVVSADGYLDNPSPFVKAVLAAREQLVDFPAVLMGATVARPVAYGHWLIPGKRLNERYFAFDEAKQPSDEEEARRLVARGAMWNTGSFVARASHLWRLLARRLPLQAERHSRSLEELDLPDMGEGSDHAATGEPAIHPMEVILEESNAIAVAKVDGAGFSHWGSMEEVFYSLSSPLERGWLLSRLTYERLAATTTAPRKHESTVARLEAPSARWPVHR